MSKSNDLRKALEDAKTGREELDELFHYVGKHLPDNFTPFDVADTATRILVKLNHGENDMPEFAATRKYLSEGKHRELELGASLLPYIQKYAPSFAEKYAEFSKLFFGNA